jgi:hypothetical protein
LSFSPKFIFYFFYNQKVITDQRKIEKKNLKKRSIMIFLFYRLCKNLQFPQDGLFFGGKETLEESNGPSLIKVR